MISEIRTWLAQHGLDEADLKSWGGEIRPDSIRIPSYSLDGKFQFHIVRRFLESPRYRYDPQGCRISMQLFGGYQAMQYILSSGISVTCEGFSDVIALHKAGVRNSVGLLGSFMSRTQFGMLQLLSNYTIVWVDGDEAGRNSGKDILKRRGDEYLMIFEVEGLDPAEAVAAGKPVLSWIEHAESLVKIAQSIRLDQDGELLQMVLREKS